MLPGKQYKPEDYVAMVWRRKWALIVPFILIAAGTGIYTQFLPNRYRSEARILIVPQQVPEDFVQPTVTTRLDARLQAIAQQIQSRTRLERIIQELNLYEDERQSMILEDVIEMMRRNIAIEIPRDTRGEPGYFTVAFTAQEARTAMQVTERIASQFITESLQDRTVQADQTSQFLETQLEDSRRKLLDHEQKLEAFRQKYVGQLPSQVQSNLAVMQNTQAQLQSIGETINRDRDRQLVLDKMMADLVAVSTAKQQLDAEPNGTPPPPPIAEQLERARVGLRALELRLKPEHPDLIRAKRVVAELEEKAATEELNSPIGTGLLPSRPPLAPAELTRLSQMQAERESLDRRIAASRTEEARLQKVLADYRTRVEAAPQRESQEVELTRDYGTIKQQYETLLVSTQQSRIAADLERRQIGEQFKLIDAARLPERPISPDRTRMNVMGAIVGLVVGLALIGLIEYRNTTFRTDEDITLSLALPVFAVIPAMTTRRERQTRRRRWVVAVSASVAITTAAVAVLVWKMDAIIAWVR